MRVRGTGLLSLLLVAACGVHAPAPTGGAKREAPPRLATTSASASPAAPPLPAGLHRLVGTDFDLPSTDLEPLGAMIGDRWLVALGESEHTSGGYYRMKARIMRYLVETKGFRVLAIETPWGDALTTTRWPETCNGDPKEAMAGIFPVYRDQSLAQFLSWACTFNRAHPNDPIVVWGFDVQQPWHDVRELKTFTADAEPRRKAFVEDRLRPCNGSGAVGTGTPAGKAYYDSPDGELYRSKTPYPQARYEKCQKGLADIRRWLEGSSAALVAATSEERVAFARLALASFAAFQEQIRFGVRDLIASQGARDAGMAGTFDALRRLQFPNGRVMLWAHNYHLAAAPSRLVPPSTGGCLLGAKLRDAYGDDYFPIALIGYRVRMNWGKMKFDDPPMRDRPFDFEQSLHLLQVDAALADLRGGAFDKRGVRAISGLEAAEGATVADQFAAAIYLEESAPMVRVDLP